MKERETDCVKESREIETGRQTDRQSEREERDGQTDRKERKERKSLKG